MDATFLDASPRGSPRLPSAEQPSAMVLESETTSRLPDLFRHIISSKAALPPNSPQPPSRAMLPPQVSSFSSPEPRSKTHPSKPALLPSSPAVPSSAMMLPAQVSGFSSPEPRSKTHPSKPALLPNSPAAPPSAMMVEPDVNQSLLPNLCRRSARPSTIASTQQASFASPPRRTVIPIGATASLLRTPDHASCNDFNPDKTRIKVDVRLSATFDRFVIAHTWRCATSRGRTHLNGSQAHCKSLDLSDAQAFHCQAAHASITPRLTDDFLVIVAEHIKETGFQGASPARKLYFHHRFSLTTPQRKQIQGDQPDVEFVDALVQRVPPKQRSSFAGTVKELQRNSTYEQPHGANRIDCSIEKVLRLLEDFLATQCSNQELTPQEAMVIFLQKYAETVETLVRNIETRLKEFEEFLSLHEKIQTSIANLQQLTPETTPEEMYESFLADVANYLALKKELKNKLSGTPALNNFLSFSLGAQIGFLLQQLIKNKDPINAAIVYFHATKNQFKAATIDAQAVTDLREEMSVRLQEAQTQLGKVKAIMEDTPSFVELYYGVLDASGVRVAPTKEQLHAQLVSLSQSNSLPEDSS